MEARGVHLVDGSPEQEIDGRHDQEKDGNHNQEVPVGQKKKEGDKDGKRNKKGSKYLESDCSATTSSSSFWKEVGTSPIFPSREKKKPGIATPSPSEKLLPQRPPTRPVLTNRHPPPPIMGGYGPIVPYKRSTGPYPRNKGYICIEQDGPIADTSIDTDSNSWPPSPLVKLETVGIVHVDVIERGSIGCYYATSLHKRQHLFS